MKLRFYPKQLKNETTTIFCRISHKGKSFKIYTKVTIFTKYWDQGTQSVTNKHALHLRVNKMLSKFKDNLNKKYYDFVIENESISFDELKKLLTDKDKVNNISLFEFINVFIERQKNRVIKAVVNRYGMVRNQVFDFDQKANFKDLNFDWFSRFEKHLLSKDYSTNYINKVLSIFKQFLRAADEESIKVNQAFKSNRINVKTEDSYNIYLSDIELKRFAECEIPEHLIRVRDIFLIGCYTGLRVSDYKNLSIGSIKGGKIYKETQKQKDRIVIPINAIVQEIIERNSGFPGSTSEKNINEGIKIIGRLSNINEIVTKGITKGGQRIQTTYKKYELIVSHTARRSFATNAFLAEVPIISIMLITGHKTETQFMKYIKISQLQNAELLENHPFFKKR